MTPDEVYQRVAAVNELYRTAANEDAHIAEDDLWESVLTAIAEGSADGPKLAERALLTRQPYPENSRWYS